MKRKILSALLATSLLVGSSTGALSVAAAELEKHDVSDYVITESDVPLRLYYDEEASHGVAQGYDDVDTYFGSGSSLIAAHPNDDWERWSIPIGNGYFGANLFGRTEIERIQLTEKTLANPYRIVNDSSLPTDGLNNFSETYIDFGHTNSAVTDYSRELDLKTAISTVKYNYSGVTYSREYFTSYPDKALVIKLDASENGALDFVLRPTVPYEQEYMTNPGDNGGKTGTVTSYVSEGVGNIVLSGSLNYFGIDFVGLYKVYTDGTLTATTCINEDGDTDGTITVSGATSAYIVVTMGTDYELSSETFTSGSNKPTKTTTLADAMRKVEGYMQAASVYSYDELKERHLADYTEIFGRVSLDLDCKESDFALTTDELLTQYKNGSGSSYLEALYFQYGRYLLIASSRSGALPSNLQGTWNRYNHSPWSSGYWHNINVQMNYWPAFSTNIAETFEAYVEYNNAYMAKASGGADSIVKQYNPEAYGKDGGNGWSIATGGYVSDIYGSESIGNLGFTTQLFWDYYAYSCDEELLREVVYPVLVSAARFITKMVKEDANGNYIAISSDSPEQYVDGVWYFTSEGTGYAQSFAYQNNYNLLLAARDLGISTDDTSHEDYAILNTVLNQIDKYDPVRVGLSGQVKEFFEEDYYGDLGEYTHRHISQLVGLYPGNVINSTTPAWIDAAKYTLTERGDKATGWGVAHRLNLWARVQDGERAYDLLEQLLKVNTATNLWDLHPPFQIDGNLGGTSGIAEMLLQSHAGYVEPLAAIPSAWANGSYTGLVARGNFEVSAAWANGLATSFNILSKSGGALSVKYSGIENATVTDSKGRVVSYTVSGTDLITFDTEEGETYYIFGFTAKHAPEAVTSVAVQSEVLGSSDLSWNASSDAVAYKVYVAKDDAPDYTLLTVTRDTKYTYERPENENARLTFAVTAVGEDGSESARALAYRNPDDLSSPVLDVSANVVNGELQVVISSTEYAEKFRLYTKASVTAEWTLVEESKYPVIIDDTYVKTNVYGVSAVSRFSEESEIVKIGVYNVSTGTVDFNSANILEGVAMVPSKEGETYKHSSTTYGDYGKLTDGDFNTSTGRFSTKATANDVLEGTLTLPAAFLLGELKIYDFNGWPKTADHAGQHLKVEVYYNGAWTTVKECFSNAEIVALRKSDAKGNYLSVDLTMYKAQLIRIRIDTPASGGSITLNEIQCTGVAIGDGLVDCSNVFTGYKFSATNPSAGSEWKKYEYITDGLGGWSDPGRFATVSGKAADGTLDFGGKVYVLSELSIEYTAANLSGKDITIYVLRNGVWNKVLEKTYTDGVSKITFDLGCVEAEKVRFTVSGQRSDGNYIGISEMTCTGYEMPYVQAATENILLGTTKDQLTLTGATVHPSVPNLDYAFDGNKSTRYAVNDKAPYTYSLEIALKDTYELHLMSFYPFYNGGEKSRSDDTKIEVYSNGAWVTVVTGFTIEPAYCSQVSLGGIVGNKIRITFNNTQTSQNATLYEIECTGIARSGEDSKENVNSNVLANRTADQLVLSNASVHPGAGPLTAVFDEDKGTRFALAGAPAYAALEITLDSIVPLYTMAIYPFYSGDTVSRSNDTKIEVYTDGIWITVASGVEIAPTAAPTIVSLGGVSAEKIRITFKNKTGTTNASIFEITCTTGVVDAVDRRDLLAAYEEMDAVALSGAGTLEIKQAKLNEMKALLMNTKADQATVDEYVLEINAATEYLKGLASHECAGGKATCTEYAVCTVCGAPYGELDSNAHDWDDGVITKNPTCSEEGVKTYTCKHNASHTYTKKLSKEEHSYNAVVTAPTCTDAGYTTYTCSVCGHSYVADNKAALGHTETTVPGKAATCTEDGLTDGVICTVCGETITAQTVIASGGHTDADKNYICDVCDEDLCTDHIEEAVPGKSPTCTETGLTEGKKCSICGEILLSQEEIAVKEHSYNAQATAPDCENGGYTTYTCSVCGHSYVADNKAPLGHSESTVPGKSPTCTEAGLTDGKACTVCGKTTLAQTVIVANGHADADKDYTCDVCGEDLCTDHNEENIPGKAPTCTEVGLTEGKRCSNCGDILVPQEVIAPIGHSYNATVTAPTCENKGYTTYTCFCGDSYVTDETEVNGHSEIVVPGNDATCTSVGFTDGKICSVCGKVTVYQTVITHKGHSYEADTVAPDCLNGGYTTFTCTECGYSYVTNKRDPLGHSYSAAVTEPDCLNGGYTTFTCTECGHSYVGMNTEPKEHKADVFVVENIVAPTCTVDGTYDKVIYCTVCKEELSRESASINALGHTAGNARKENNVAPDCLNDGSYDNVVYCTDCGEVLSVEHVSVDATGHTAGKTVTENNIAPTCTRDGRYDNATYCTVCEAELSRETVRVDAIGHDFEDATTESPKTCKVCGKTEGEKLPTEDTAPDTDVDDDITVEEDHSECKAQSELERIVSIIINFFRKLLGLPEKCLCGEDL